MKADIEIRFDGFGEGLTEAEKQRLIERMARSLRRSRWERFRRWLRGWLR